jgi:hypothetical protein
MGLSITTQPTSVLAAVGSAATFTVVAAHTTGTANILYQWMKNGTPIQGQNASTLIFSSITPDDSEVYSCEIHDDVDDTILNTVLVVLASSILDNIELNIKIKILGMTVTGGYNFDWKTVNQENEAIGDFPRALIDSPAETNLDPTNGDNSQAYSNDVLFIIRVKGSQQWSSNANFTIRSNLRLAMDDLKKLFGPNGDSSVNGSCDEIMYRSHQVIALNQNEIQRPGYLRSQWLAKYSQDRATPLQYTSS